MFQFSVSTDLELLYFEHKNYNRSNNTVLSQVPSENEDNLVPSLSNSSEESGPLKSQPMKQVRVYIYIVAICCNNSYVGVLI